MSIEQLKHAINSVNEQIAFHAGKGGRDNKIPDLYRHIESAAHSHIRANHRIGDIVTSDMFGVKYVFAGSGEGINSIMVKQDGKRKKFPLDLYKYAFREVAN